MRHHRRSKRTLNVMPTQSECTVCGTVFPFWRRNIRRKPEGHIKDLWCITCRQETPHAERREHPLEMEQQHGT